MHKISGKTQQSVRWSMLNRVVVPCEKKYVLLEAALVSASKACAAVFLAKRQDCNEAGANLFLQ